MKTKALIVLIAGVLALSANAQDFKCEDNYKVLEQKVKEQAYDEAVALLPGLRKSCPKYTIKLYTLGETVLKYKMETTRPEKEKKVFSDDLFALYNEQEKNFPGTGGVLKKALLLHQKKLVTNDDAFKMLDASFASHKASFTDYNVLELYFNLYLERYTKGDKGITQEQFIQKVSDIAGQVAYAKSQWEDKRAALLKKKETLMLEDDEAQFLTEAPLSISAFEAVSDNVVKQSSKHFTCDKLEAFYSAQYDKNKADSAWLMGMVTVLSATKCTASATLYTGAQELYKQKPSAQWALALGNLALKKDKKAAAAYYEEAATLEPDTLKKADIYLTVFNAYRNSDKAAAKKYAVKSAEFNPKNGKAYLQLAEMYAAAAVQKDCQLSDFDKKAVYWLAIATAKKAEVAEPKYKSTVESLVKRYETKVPTKQDLKTANKSKGDTITFGCWINESITVPKL
jgi:tetratricopeptide (TPR) repeat protein